MCLTEYGCRSASHIPPGCPPCCSSPIQTRSSAPCSPSARCWWWHTSLQNQSINILDRINQSLSQIGDNIILWIQIHFNIQYFSKHIQWCLNIEKESHASKNTYRISWWGASNIVMRSLIYVQRYFEYRDEGNPHTLGVSCINKDISNIVMRRILIQGYTPNQSMVWWSSVGCDWPYLGLG